MIHIRFFLEAMSFALGEEPPDGGFISADHLDHLWRFAGGNARIGCQAVAIVGSSNQGKKKMVRKVGFEPTRLAAPPPQDGASASSATSARGIVKLIVAKPIRVWEKPAEASPENWIAARALPAPAWLARAVASRV
jgi:hypothetical protein